MELYEKIRFMRMFKGWSQEEMAEKLDMAVSGYAKIERGETDINFSRLQQIAQVFGIELAYLVGLSEKNVFNIIGSCNNSRCNHSPFTYFSVSTLDPILKQENEKLHIINEQQAKEIDYLKEIIKLISSSKTTE